MGNTADFANFLMNTLHFAKFMVYLKEQVGSADLFAVRWNLISTWLTNFAGRHRAACFVSGA